MKKYPINKWTKELNREFYQDELYMASKYLKHVQHPGPSGKCKLKLSWDSVQL